MNKSIVYRFDANHALGYGHLMRCLTLAKQMERAGHHPVFLIGPDISGTAVNLLGINATVYQLPENYVENDEMDALAKVIEMENPSGVAVDLLLSSFLVMELIAKANLVLLAIDDLFTNNYMADIVVSSNPLATSNEYVGSDAELLLGMKFQILRPEFAQTANEESGDIKENVIFICFGGSDPINYTLKLVDVLYLMEMEMSATIVVGQAYEDYNFLVDSVSDLKIPVDPRQGVENPWELMRGASLAICSIGSTCWELMTLGVPCIALSQNENQARYADELDAEGAIIHFARNKNFADADLAWLLADTLRNSDKRAQLREKGRELVDGKGVERVAKSFIAMLKGAN